MAIDQNALQASRKKIQESIEKQHADRRRQLQKVRITIARTGLEAFSDRKLAKAIQQFNLAGKTIFGGHELNPNTRQLLETGIMNFVIGHDVLSEEEAAAQHVEALLNKRPPTIVPLSPVRIYTKYSCN